MFNRLLVFLLLGSLSGSSLYSTTRYVKTDGDDEANGLSLENAYLTIRKGQENTAAGDTLFINAGTYTDTGSNCGILFKKLYATSADPTVIKGLNGVPLLDMEWQRYPPGENKTYCVRAESCANFKFDSIAVTKVGEREPTEGYDAVGIHLYFSDTITVQDCEASYVRSSCYATGCDIGACIGIQDSRNVLALRNTVHHASSWHRVGLDSTLRAGGGVYMFQYWDDESEEMHDNVVDSCIAYECGTGICASKSHPRQSRFIIQYCTAYDNGKGITSMSDSCTIRFNLVYDNPEFGIMLDAHYYGEMWGDSVYNNTAVNNGVGIAIQHDGHDTMWVDSVSSFNNIIVGYIDYAADDDTVEYRYRHYDSTLTDFYTDYNCFWNTEIDEIAHDAGPFTLAELVPHWVSVGWVRGCDSNSIQLDPYFDDPDNDIYTLSDSSPCLTAGLGGTYMGAFEPAGEPEESARLKKRRAFWW